MFEKDKIKAIVIYNLNTLFWIYLVLTIIAGILLYFRGNVVFDGVTTTHYNNFLTFKYSFRHLIDNKDIYTAFPHDHWDLFKYSPAFALFMGIFYYLPELPGLILWNLLNTIPLFFAIKGLQNFDSNKKALVLWFIIIELLTSIQNAQSNGLTLALIVFGFNSFEKKNVALAALFLSLSAFIKIFGILAFVIFLFYPDKLKFICYSVLWFLFLLFIPLLVVSSDQLMFLYRSWLHLLTWDEGASIGISVRGIIAAWFGLDIPNKILLIPGLIFLMLPLIRFKEYKEYTFRLFFLAGMLIWMVIFNHKAESPTFIIAVGGAALWYFYQKKTWLDFTLIVFLYLLTCLSATDIFPPSIRQNIIKPYNLKALPCIIIWLKIIYDILFGFYKSNKNNKIELNHKPVVQQYL